MHCFEIRTANLDYYIGEDPLYGGVKDPNKVIMPPPDSGIGTHLAKSWETAIRQALMPVTPQASISALNRKNFVKRKYNFLLSLLLCLVCF